MTPPVTPPPVTPLAPDAPTFTLELADPASGARAQLAPNRGALVTGFQVGGRDVLFLDEATFQDLKANVRGGVPVLFPSPGKLENDAWARDGRSGAMKQHGFARQLPWTVTERSPSSATLSLRATPDTLRQYPWDFEAAFTFSVSGRALRIDQRITNRSDAPMPFGVGFHPYFRVPDAKKAEASIPTRATRAFDNTVKQVVPFPGFDLTRPEVDLHLLDHGAPRAELLLPDGRVTVECSDELSWWVVWTLKGRDFVCLEPWTCPGNALNTGDRLLRLEPGETRALRMAITFDPA